MLKQKSTLSGFYLCAILLGYSGLSWGDELVSCENLKNGSSVLIQREETPTEFGTKRLWATVKFHQNDPIEYLVEFYRGPMSISHGRIKYIDQATGGQLFQVLGPSTNFQRYSLHLNVPQSFGDGENETVSMGDLQSIQDDDLECSLFRIDDQETFSQNKDLI